MPRFRFKIGDKTMVLSDGVHLIGRAPECWLVLDDDLVSRQHARIHVTDHLTEVEDLGSRNGTFVNGTRIFGRRELQDGDRVRIGSEIIAAFGLGGSGNDDLDMRRTLAPGEEAQFPSLIGQLIDKSIRAGKLKEAERYATALVAQLSAARVPHTHPAAEAGTRVILLLAEKTASGTWIDRLFRLYTQQGWIMGSGLLEDVRSALDRIPRVPGAGLRGYEQFLRDVPDGNAAPELVAAVAELADAYSST